MKLNKYFKLLSALVATTMLFSCDKTETFDPIGEGGQKIIKIANYGGVGTNFGNSNLVFDPASTSEIVDVQLELSAPSVSTSDITVTVEADPAAVTAYNATKTDPKEQYFLLPPAAYTFASPTNVVIRAGQSLSEVFQIEFNPSMIDGSKNNMLPLTIKSISGGPSDLKAAPSTGTAYFHFIGNPQAGSYSSTSGFFYHPTVPRAIPNGTAKNLIPSTPVSLIFEVGDFNTIVQPGNPILGLLTLDPVTNKVTVAPAPGPYAVYTQATLVELADLPNSNPGYAPFPGSTPSIYNNTYDPVTKKFYLRYGYMGANGWRVIEEVLTKN